MKSGFFILILFLILSYTFSSWWAWDFGCSYGSRSFVEYLSLFSIPVAYAYSRIAKLNLNKRLIFYVIIIVLITLNLKMIYSYDGCFQGTSNWDWSAYIQLINSPTK